MHMLDWNIYRRQLFAGVGDTKLSPDVVKGYKQLRQAGARTGYLDAKIRDLIALGVATSLRCDGCTAVHVAEARKLGATRKRLPKRSESQSASTLAPRSFTPPALWTRSTRPLTPEGNSP